jgi:WD40 repeat protein
MKWKLYSFFIVTFALCVVHNSVTAQSTSLPYVYATDWSDDGSRFAITTREGLTIYDSSFNPLAFHAFPTDKAFEVPDTFLSPDGSRILVNTEIWDSSTLKIITVLGGADILPYTAQWSTDSTAIAFRNGDDRGTSIYSALNGNLLRAFSSSSWQVGAEYGPKWSPNNVYFATLGALDAVLILDAVTGKDIARYPVKADRIDYLSWSPDSTRIALVTTSRVKPGSPGSYPEEGSPDKALRISIIILTISNGQVTTNIIGIQGGIYSLIWSSDGKQLAGNTSFSSILVWDPNTGVLLDSYQAPPYRTLLMDYSRYSSRLMIGSNIGYPISPPQGRIFTPMSTYMQNELGGIIQIVVPAPSLEKLQAISEQCKVQPAVQQMLTAQIQSKQLPTFIQQVSALTDTQILPGCKADLLAVAEALQAK